MGAQVETMAYLHAHGLNVEPEGLPRVLREVIEGLQRLYYPSAGQEGLTAAEIQVYRSGGLDPAPRDLGVNDPFLRGVTTFAGLVETGLTAVESAKLLGVTDARIRQRLKERTLFAIKWGGAWRLPLFQFADGRELPGWGEVARNLPDGISPVAVAHWLMLPNVELALGEDEIPTSPRHWLLEGRPPQAVARLAEALG
ncbi:hypothetical protein [Mesoterricola sediminis]|uniref:DNA-binding protein n=1 Tax=Mesoterricola sediminis TaxID=2927980 RepID=A0AA48KC12_9BACT|nr:hypothetical protein [Mesoterricola sediminis]BDU76506.1 hypothetical protein METESE_14640 [Mesoterricola sediminis]